MSIFNAMRVMELHSVCGFVEESCDVEQLLFPQGQRFFGLAEHGVRVHVCSCLTCGITMLTKLMNFEHIFRLRMSQYHGGAIFPKAGSFAFFDR